MSKKRLAILLGIAMTAAALCAAAGATPPPTWGVSSPPPALPLATPTPVARFFLPLVMRGENKTEPPAWFLKGYPMKGDPLGNTVAVYFSCNFPSVLPEKVKIVIFSGGKLVNPVLATTWNLCKKTGYWQIVWGLDEQLQPNGTATVTYMNESWTWGW